MIEWLWQTLVVQRFDRIAHGGLRPHDVTAALAFAGACIVATIWFMRRLGRKADADRWEDNIRETAQTAEREGWHGVSEWHRRAGYVGTRSPSLGGWVFLVCMGLLFGSLYLATR
ncbi:MAG: hypothetical protein HC869_16290 [Rhodospirillales bacterium]|nr:hypothetical protein [Rhodospirillales bacterium]